MELLLYCLLCYSRFEDNMRSYSLLSSSSAVGGLPYTATSQVMYMYISFPVESRKPNKRSILSLF